MTRKLATLTEVAAELSIDLGLMSRWAKRRGFPTHTVKGQRRFDSGEVAAWLARNIKPRKATAKGAAVPLAGRDDPHVQTLMSGTASALEVCRAAQVLAARQLAQGALSGSMGAADVEMFKKLHAELREQEVGFIEIEMRKKNLEHFSPW